jgi:hypothetical protein
MQKKNIPVIFTIILLLFSFSLVWADDDDDEEGDDRPASSSSSSSNDTKVETSVKVDTKTTIIRDSDGDGIFDGQDIHPGISEIYIVEDNNFNGIVDKFEK